MRPVDTVEHYSCWDSSWGTQATKNVLRTFVMKTLLYRVMTSSLAVATLVFCVGCGEETANAANADVPTVTNTSPAPAVGDTGATPAPGAPEAKPTKPEPGDADTEDSEDETKPARVVDEPVVPEGLNISPALKEIIKLVQAG